MYRKLQTLILFIICSNAVYASAQRDSVAMIFDKVTKIYHNKESISFDYTQKFKNMMDEDTSITQFSTVILRDLNDSLFGAQAWSEKEKYTHFYCRDSLFRINHNDKKIMAYINETDESEIELHLSETYINRLFRKNNALSWYLEDSSYYVTLSSETIDNNVYHKVSLIDSCKDDVRDLVQLLFWIDSKTFHLKKVVFLVDYMGECQYDEVIYHNFKFNSTNREYLAEKFNPLYNSYEYKVYTVDSLSEYTVPELLPIDTLAPDFTGTLYDSGMEAALKDYKNKLILLDFWYVKCPGCLLYIPHLSSLYKKYKDSGFIILGLNSIDKIYNNEKIMEKIIIHNNIKYPIIMVDSSVDKSYHVVSYPTLYLINREGRVVFSECGYSESTVEALENKIKEELEKKYLINY